MKLDWKKTFFIGFGFFGISVMWQIYNSFVPIYLQAGHPGFESNVTGFGLSAASSGLIMGLDNLAAIFILPVIGVWSDRVRTPIGRRYPFILTMAPIAAIAFILMPIAAGMIQPVQNGSAISQNMGAFVLFVAGAVIMLLAMAVLRTPVISLMPDLTPSPLRSKANGVINLMGGVGTLVASFGLARLFNLSHIVPFIGAAGILILAVVLLFITTKEPKIEDLPQVGEHEESDEEQALGALRGFKIVPPAYRRSLIFLLLSIFSWFVAYDGIGTFFTSYAVNELGVSEGFAPTLFGIAGLAFLITAIPAGFLGERLGRRNTIRIGLLMFTVGLVVGYFLDNVVLIGVILAFGGIGWALVNINSLPMVVDVVDDPRLLGTYTGFYYLASQTGSALAPGITGGVVDLLGGDFHNIFLISPVFFVLAIVFMSLVTRGEAHATADTITEAVGEA